MPAAWYLQGVFGLAMMVAAVLCLGVRAPRATAGADRDTAWRLTGAGFLCHASFVTLQNAFGGIAIRAGTTSPTMATYVRWIPVMNQSRTFLLVGLMVALVLLARGHGKAGRRFWWLAAGIMAAGFAFGAGVGVYEGAFSEARHYSSVAIWDVVELIVVFVALFILLLSNRADRLLWAFISVYGLQLALGIFWLLLFSQLNSPDAWHPPLWTLHAMRLGLSLLMVALAARALVQRRRGNILPGMLEPRQHSLSPLH